MRSSGSIKRNELVFVKKTVSIIEGILFHACISLTRRPARVMHPAESSPPRTALQVADLRFSRRLRGGSVHPPNTPSFDVAPNVHFSQEESGGTWAGSASRRSVMPLDSPSAKENRVVLDAWRGSVSRNEGEINSGSGKH